MINEKIKLKITHYNKVEYRGVTINVIPEIIEEMNSGNITEQEAIDYFEKIWKRELQQMRIEKLRN
jgi:hypothetical protein